MVPAPVSATCGAAPECRLQAPGRHGANPVGHLYRLRRVLVVGVCGRGGLQSILTPATCPLGWGSVGVEGPRAYVLRVGGRGTAREGLTRADFWPVPPFAPDCEFA